MNKIFEVIVVGELNADLIFNQLASFPEIGKEKLAERMTLTLGSSAAIFASNLSSLGGKVAFIGKIGDDIIGRFCKQQLEDKRVDTSMVLIDNALDTGATVVLNFNEDRAMITHQGAMKHLSLADITGENISKGNHLHFSSYFLQPGFRDKLAGLFKLAKNAGMTTSFDVQWDPEENWQFDYREVIPFVDVFLPNEKELQMLTGKTNTEDAIEEIKGITKILAVKMGNRGSLLVCDGMNIFKPAFLNKEVVDAIGAGDSFNAGFIYQYIKGSPLEKCQEFANLTGAVSTTAAGGTLAFVDMNTVLKIAKEKFGYDQ